MQEGRALIVAEFLLGDVVEELNLWHRSAKHRDTAQLRTEPVLGLGKIYMSLQIQPEVRRRAKSPRETERHLRCDPSPPSHDLIDRQS